MTVPRLPRGALLWVLLTALLSVRLLLQVAVLPPYAGLDEIYHVARLEFVRNEGRNPTTREASIPAYLQWSILQRAGWQPAFGVIGARWPDVVASGARPAAVDPGEAMRRSYAVANYEAQQPSLYYAAVARLAPGGTDLDALRAWRLASAILAVSTALAVAFVGWRAAGAWGLLAAALLATLPTWEALVARASNDALACALLAVAVAITVAAPRRPVGFALEGLAWGGAVAAKLYTWPAAVVLPLLWRRQGASRRRIAAVVLLGALAVLGTLWDLSARTGNPLGVQELDSVRAPGTLANVHWGELLRTFALTLAWTSGQHWNALTPLGLLFLVLPPLLIAAFGLLRALRGGDRHLPTIVIAAGLAFLLAQAGRAFATIPEGGGVPVMGKEGWYWYALAPLFVGILLTLALRGLRSRVLVALFVGWIALWDVGVHELALFRDYAGWTTPANRGLLVRWGPVSEKPPTTLATMAVGPFAEQATPLRVAHLALLAALTVTVLRRKDPDCSGAQGAPFSRSRLRGL